MFRSASVRESEVAERTFTAHMDHWVRTANQWFDGTVASVDERLGKLDRVIRFARDVAARRGSTGAGFLCGNALPILSIRGANWRRYATVCSMGSPTGRLAPRPLLAGEPPTDSAGPWAARSVVACSIRS